MSKQVERGDVFTFTLCARGAAAALHLTESALRIGQRVLDQVVVIPTANGGIPVRQITVFGKRPGEGQIAASMKERKNVAPDN
jgi:hypothetical protein